MSEKHRILNQGSGVREVRQALELVRKPWFSGEALYTPVIMAAFVMVSVMVPHEVMPAKFWWTFGFAVFVLVSNLNQRHRDRAWRKLVEFEAPDLYRKIVSKEPTDA